MRSVRKVSGLPLYLRAGVILHHRAGGIRVLKSLCDREYVWEHGNMTENFSDEYALREFMRI